MRNKILNERIPDSIYKKIVQHVPVVTVDIVIISPDRKKILVGRRNNRPAKGIWYTLGGRLFKYESTQQAAQRLILSEASIAVPLSRLHYVDFLQEEFSDSSTGNFGTHNINFFFALILKPKTVKPDTQHVNLQWLPVTSHQIHPYARKKICLALQCV